MRKRLSLFFSTLLTHMTHVEMCHDWAWQIRSNSTSLNLSDWRLIRLYFQNHDGLGSMARIRKIDPSSQQSAANSPTGSSSSAAASSSSQRVGGALGSFCPYELVTQDSRGGHWAIFDTKGPVKTFFGTSESGIGEIYYRAVPLRCSIISQ